jgi:TRAP-type C4-dicarboxylate transport system permease small subunit
LSHGLEAPAPAALSLAESHPLAVRLDKALATVERLIVAACAIAVLAAAGILTYSVAARYFFKIATDWQDECAVFLLVGATFLSTAWVQRARGHIGIEALASVLPPGVDRWRRRLIDVAGTAFCAFFSWKSWTLLEEAVVEGQHAASSWGPPLWIPYGLMAAGMTLLTLRIALQVLAHALPAPGSVTGVRT